MIMAFALFLLLEVKVLGKRMGIYSLWSLKILKLNETHMHLKLHGNANSLVENENLN